MPCSCCKGAITFDEARLVKEKLTGGRAIPNQKNEIFRAVPAKACWGIENCEELFGLVNDKEALSGVFEAGTGDTKKNLPFGSSGIVSTVGEICPMTPSRSSRVCAQSSSNRAPRHKIARQEGEG